MADPARQRVEISPVAKDDPALLEGSVVLAEQLLQSSLTASRRIGRRRELRLRRILESAAGTTLVFGLADRALRPVSADVGLAQLGKVVAADLSALGPIDRLLVRAGLGTGHLSPGAVMALVRARVRHDTRPLVFSARPNRLRRALAGIQRHGASANVNLLGEAILGEAEARRRVEATASLLGYPDVRCVSMKVSSMASWLSLLDFDGSVERLTARLGEVCRLALGASEPKVIMLDMEEHRDLDLTVAVLRWALEAVEFESLEFGIALQAYLPETHRVVDDLLIWACRRAERGGAGLRIRLVKGANLAMERVEAEVHGWPTAPYGEKAGTDASYVRLLDRLLRPEHEPFLHVGLGTHNLFDLAYGLRLAAARGMGQRVEPEMLAGMAGRQAEAVARLIGDVLLYVPVVADEDFHTSIAYLARRLDENATPEGFLRHALELTPDSEAWRQQRSMFVAAARSSRDVRTSPHQTQDRTRPAPPLGEGFANEPDTDLSVAANRGWARRSLTHERPSDSPAVATPDDVERALAVADRASWPVTSTAERRRILRAVADVMRSERGLAVATMSDEAGKTFEEADPEVSEAVDYARWYAEETGLLDGLANEATFAPLGVVVVVPPWNFPYAIPANGVLAALAAANRVILKPSPEARKTGQLLVDQLHRAGVPEDVLQLVAAPDDEAGHRLVTHESVDAVILTGSWDSAQMFARWRPGLRLLAETSGKNAIVVSATADVDQAVHDVVLSAFGHAGQKCSAASLAIVDNSIHDRSSFLRQLADATSSLRVGPATDPATQVGPIVGPLTDRLVRALTRLDPGESWLVEPRRLEATGRLWSPGVRLGVRPGSWAHTTEWFGPMLGVMRTPDLETAIRLQNAVPFGLTAGIQSLDRDEQIAWAEAVEAGNLTINRPTTGAIVGRQPFGGWKRSAYGPTAKAGGPNYLINLGRWRDAQRASLPDVERSYRRWWDSCFAAPRDRAGLVCEENSLRYRPLPGAVVRVNGPVDPDQVARAVLAAEVAGTPVAVSVSVSAPASPNRSSTDVVHEDVDQLARRLDGEIRLRLLGSPEPTLLAAAAEAGVTVVTDPVSACGRVELPRWLREQVISRTRHRYGNLID